MSHSTNHVEEGVRKTLPRKMLPYFGIPSPSLVAAELVALEAWMAMANLETAVSHGVMTSDLVGPGLMIRKCQALVEKESHDLKVSVV